MKQILERLKNPTILLSVVSQIVAMLILVGVKIDEQMALTLAGMGVSILGSLGILSKKGIAGYAAKTENLTCSNSGEVEPHVLINGQMVCTKCGAVYTNEDKTPE